MWLIVMMFAAVIATALWYIYDDRRETYALGFLALIFWGTSIMVLVDHVMGYLAEGGEFIEVTPDAALLSMTLVLTALIIWEIVLIIRDPERILRGIKGRS